MLIEIVNWEKYNPRSDVKHTTWFRLENNFYADPVIFRLDNDAKMIWITLLALASHKMRGLIEVEVEFLSSVLKVPNAKVTDVLLALQDSGRIEHPTSRQASRRSSRPRTSSNERTNERTNETAGCALFDLWNASCGPLPKSTRLSKSRQAKIRLRLVEEDDPDYWRVTVERLAKSDFATGKNDRGWKATFDWLIANDHNHVKVNEGKYDNRSPTKKSDNAKILTAEDLADV